MKITFDWLKDHLDTKLNEDKLLEQLTNVEIGRASCRERV